MTRRQKIFVKEYLIDLNATQAAIRAGYSKKTANRIGARLLSNVVIQQAIQEAMRKREQDTGITAERVLKEIATIAFASVDDKLSYRDKIKALELLGKHQALFVDRVEHSGEVNIVVDVDEDSHQD